MGKTHLTWCNLDALLEQVGEATDELTKAGFKVRKIEINPDHFLISTDHGGNGEGAVSRWSSSWVRRYEFK